jgi:hypothetical protein
MNVRIAAVIATVLLAASIGAWLWMDREYSEESDARSDAMNPSQVAAEDGAIPRPLESGISRTPVSPTASREASASAHQPGSPPPTTPPQSAPFPSALTTPPLSPPVAGTPLASPDPDQSEKASIDVDHVGLMLRDYRTRMGENPFGTNAEIMKAVMGENPKQAKLGPPEGQKLNAAGELVDRWGTPYFFHQLSKSSMEVRSAGPDKVMWSEDDVVQR